VEEAVVVEEPEAESDSEEVPEAEETPAAGEAPTPKKKTRRGSRGGRKRKKTPATAEAAETKLEADSTSEEAPEPSRAVTIHVPGEDLGRPGTTEPVEAPAAELEPGAAEEPTTAEGEVESTPKPKKKTRRGSRGGKNRKKKPATAAQNGSEAVGGEAPAEVEPASENGDFEYVPMSEWADELETNR
jgi:ribonuclease E